MSGGLLGGSDCDEGWSHPVYVERLPPAKGAVPLPPTSAAQFELPQGILDVPDIAMVPLEQQVESLIRLCGGSLRVDDASDDHFGELNGDVAIVRMQVARLLDTLPATNASRIRLADGLLGACKDKSAATLRAEVSAAIRASTVMSEPGPHVDALVRTGVTAVTGVSHDPLPS